MADPMAELHASVAGVLTTRLELRADCEYHLRRFRRWRMDDTTRRALAQETNQINKQNAHIDVLRALLCETDLGRFVDLITAYHARLLGDCSRLRVCPPRAKVV